MIKSIAISLGSNINPKENLQSAKYLLKDRFSLIKSSSIYSSKSEGFNGEDFLNQVVICKTELDFVDVIASLKEIEKRLGRKKEKRKFSDRLIDLDLLTYGSEILKKNDKEVPHKDIETYSFVLVPLVEVMPYEIHPKLGISFFDLLKDKKNFRSTVTKIT